MNVNDVKRAILAGDLDGQRSAINEAFKSRKKIIAEERKAELEPGDVVIVNGLRPKYINGLEAQVQSIARTRAEIKFLDPHKAGRFGSAPVKAPIANLTPVT